MNTLETLKQLHDDLISISKAKDFKDKASAVFTSAHCALSGKEAPLDYNKNPASELLREIAPLLQQLLQKTSDSNTPVDSYLEREMLQTIKQLQIPMDFRFKCENSVLSMADITAQLCENITASIKHLPLNSSELTTLLATMVHLDLEGSERLYKAGKLLITALFDEAKKRWNGAWRLKDSIHLLWANALLSLYLNKDNDNNNNDHTNFLDWKTVCVILRNIETKVNTKAALSEKLARQLFQVYAANYKQRQSFPQALLSDMQSYLIDFENQAHGSPFEKRLHHVFDMVVEKLVKLYPYINWKNNLRFDNPIMDFGSETDILFFDRDTQVRLAIQVDGMKYHSYPACNAQNRRLNLRTKFRNFCFAQAQCNQIEIKDEDEQFLQLIEAVLVENVVFPIHQLHGQKLIAELKQKAQQITDMITERQQIYQELKEDLPSEAALHESILQIHSLRTQLLSLKQKNPEKSDIDEQLKELQQLETQIGSLHEHRLQTEANMMRLSEFSKDFTQMSQLITEAEMQLHNLKSTIIGTRLKHHELSAEIAKLESEIAHKKENREKFKSQQSTHVRALKDQKAKLNKLKEIIQKIENDAFLDKEEHILFLTELGEDESKGTTKKSQKRKIKSECKSKLLQHKETLAYNIWNYETQIATLEALFLQQDKLEEEIRRDGFALESMETQLVRLEKDLFKLDQLLQDPNRMMKPIVILHSSLTSALSSLTQERVVLNFGNYAEGLKLSLSKIGEKTRQIEQACQTLQIKQLEAQLTQLQVDKENAAPNAPCYIPSLAKNPQDRRDSNVTKNNNNTCKIEENRLFFVPSKKGLKIYRMKQQ